MWHIIYPFGIKTQIDIIELQENLFELNDYAIASRKEFYDKDYAIDYAIELARNNGKTYVGPPKITEFPEDYNTYLD
jgi:hypothetical protein